MKKIFILTCNPKEHSQKEDCVKTYINTAIEKGHDVRIVNIYDLNVDYLRANGDDFDNTLSDELKQAQDNVLWADQLVFVYPIWWLSMPAIMKSFIEKTFAEGVVSNMSKMGPKPLMKDKTAVIMQSYDAPYFAVKYLWGDVQMKWWKVVLTDWCGPKIVKRFDFDMIGQVSDKKKQKWIKDVKKFVESL